MDYYGDFMIEVDEPSVESKLESHRISFEWARRSLPGPSGLPGTIG
jgi:inosose dehydratase